MSQLEAKEIGARIAKARDEAGLTQDQVADLATFSKRSLQDYEAGVTIPYRQMQEIARLLRRDVAWFLHGDQDGSAQLTPVAEEVADIRVVLNAMAAAQGLDPEALIRAERERQREAEGHGPPGEAGQAA